MLTGSAGSNGTVHGTPAAAEARPRLAPQHRAARADVGAPVPGGQHRARLRRGPAPRSRCSPARPRRLASSAERLRLALKTAFIVSIVKPAGPEPVGAGQPLLGLHEPEPRAQQPLRALRADDAREAGRAGSARSAASRSRWSSPRSRAASRAGAPSGRGCPWRRRRGRCPSARLLGAVEQDHARGQQQRRLRGGRAALLQRGVDVRHHRVVGVVGAARGVGRDHVDPRVALHLRRRAAQVADGLARLSYSAPLVGEAEVVRVDVGERVGVLRCPRSGRRPGSRTPAPSASRRTCAAGRRTACAPRRCGGFIFTALPVDQVAASGRRP